MRGRRDIPNPGGWISGHGVAPSGRRDEITAFASKPHGSGTWNRGHR
jgi:hypothetical protein